MSNSEGEFTIRKTPETDKVGSYEILYRLSLNRHPEIYAESPAPFIVTVVDPCDFSLTSFKAPFLED